MHRVHLSASEQDELRKLSRGRDLTGRERDRLEMVRLCSVGWSASRIAEHLGYHAATVRRHLRSFKKEGFASLSDQPRAGRPRRVTEEHLEALDAMLATTTRAWSAKQLSVWLLDELGVEVSADHLTSLLRGRGYRYKRTKTSVQHKANPNAQAQKARTGA